jgi:hypothetical protein
MVVADREVDAETIPRIAMAILEVVTETALQVTGKAYIVELAPAVEHIDAFAPSHIFVD